MVAAEGGDRLGGERLAPDHQHDVRRADLQLPIEPADEVPAAEPGQQAGPRVEVEPRDRLSVPLEGALPLRGVRVEGVVVRGDDQDARHAAGSGSRNCRS